MKDAQIVQGRSHVGMIFPMVAAVAPAGAATLGDLAVQGFHMGKNMITGLITGIPVGIDMIGNALSGEFAANAMTEGSMHAASEMASTPLQDPSFIADAHSFGMTPEEYAQGWLFNHKQ